MAFRHTARPNISLIVVRVSTISDPMSRRSDGPVDHLVQGGVVVVPLLRKTKLRDQRVGRWNRGGGLGGRGEVLGDPLIGRRTSAAWRDSA